MKHSWEVGFSFGLTSGVITTLGLMTGLYSGTGSKNVVLAGIFTIALADALSDAFGIHISEEAEAKHSPREIWSSTFSTFFFKLITSLTFVVPFLFLGIKEAVITGFIWGGVLLTGLSVSLAKKEKMKPYRVVLEHLVILVVVVICTYLIGKGVALLL